MSVGDTSEFRRKLEALSAAYRATLPATLAALVSGWRQVEVAGLEAPSARELQRSAHSIAGSAGSFGMREVSERARELEHFIMELQARGGPTLPEDSERFRVLFGALERAAVPQP